MFHSWMRDLMNFGLGQVGDLMKDLMSDLIESLFG